MYKKNDGKEFCATQIRFTALLKTAVHNKKLNYMEKKYNTFKHQSSFESREFSVSDPTDFIQSIFDAELLKLAMDSLTEREKRVLVYRFIEGLSLPEIAERENLQYMATAVLLHRILEKLRKIIRGIDDEF